MHRLSLLLAVTVIGVGVSSAFDPETQLSFTPSSLSNTRFVVQDDSVGEESLGPVLDDRSVVGHQRCIDCHVAEYEAWTQSPHYRRGFALLATTSPSRVEGYAEAIGMSVENVTKVGACIQCHATPITAAPDDSGNPSVDTSVITSVSCEACHNPAGGSNGWLERHSSYGRNGTTRELESESHHRSRHESCLSAGHLTSDVIVSMIERCADCHIPQDERLVEAGHTHNTMTFRIESLLSSSIRHNFHLNPHENPHVSSLWLNSMHQPPMESRDELSRLKFYAVLMPLVDARINVRLLTEDWDIDLGGDLAENSMERMNDSADYLAELCQSADGDFEEAVECLEEVLEAQLDLFDEDPEDNDDFEDLFELNDALAEVLPEEGTPLRELWELYASLKSWGYHFTEEGSVEDLYDYEFFDGATFDYSQDAYETFAADFEARFIQLTERYGLGDSLPDFELSLPEN